MSVIALTPHNFDYTTLNTYPSRSFSSSSSGLTGSVYLYPERSQGKTLQKAAYFSNASLDAAFGASSEFNIIELTNAMQLTGLEHLDGGTTSIAPLTHAYLSASQFLPKSEQLQRRIDIKRGRPTPGLTSASLVKNFAKNVLYRDYAAEMSNPNWAYTNYNCLKFFTGSKVPETSVLIYPAFTRSIYMVDSQDPDAQSMTADFMAPSITAICVTNMDRHRTATYTPFIPHPKLGPFKRSLYVGLNQGLYGKGLNPGIKNFENQIQFTFEFWIKPNIKEVDSRGVYRAGTLMHMSSTYAISLVSGSYKDPAGRPEGFRMMLQLSHSAERVPGAVSLNAPNNSDWPDHTVSSYTGLRSYPNDLVFLSSDNSLKFNHWHHVAIRWGSDVVNDGVGDFVIDGKVDATFTIPSGTVFSSPCLRPGYNPQHVKTPAEETWDFSLVWKSVPGQNYRQEFSTRSLGCTPIGHIREEPNALFIGNFYEGKNSPYDGSQISRFFNDVAAENEGVFAESSLNCYTGTPQTKDPVTGPDSSHLWAMVNFRYPLRAEVHELRIWQTYRSLEQIVTGSTTGVSSPISTIDIGDHIDGATWEKLTSLGTRVDEYAGSVTLFGDTDGSNVPTWPYYSKTGGVPRRNVKLIPDLLFYLPVLFTKYSGPRRKVLQSPIQFTKRGHTWDPFNVELSFRNNAVVINTNNFLRDFVTGYYPRQFHMTASGMYNTEKMLEWSDDPTQASEPGSQAGSGEGIGAQSGKYLDGYGNAGQVYLGWQYLVDTFGTPTQYRPQKLTAFGWGHGDGPYGSEVTSKESYAAERTVGTLRRKASLRRNLLVMPCDNGLFRPDWTLLLSGTGGSVGKDSAAIEKNLAFQTNTVLTPISGSNLDKFTNDLGHLDLSLISLKNMWKRSPEMDWMGSWSAAYDDLLDDPADPELLTHVIGPTPVYLGTATYDHQMGGVISPGKISKDLPAMIHFLEGPRLTPSASSNAISWWNISNIFYGDRIRPESVKLRGSVGCWNVNKQDCNLFSGTFMMTLRDNERGSLYRADAATLHATWNSVGDVFYNEGLVMIKSPHIHDLGLADFEGYEMSFVGDRNVHVLEMMFEAPAGQFSSSSNPTYIRGLIPSDHVADQESPFVYVTGLNFHDDNFNVIARSNLAQPVIKREQDKLFFRVKIDF